MLLMWRRTVIIQPLNSYMAVKFLYNFMSKMLGILKEEQKMEITCFGKDK